MENEYKKTKGFYSKDAHAERELLKVKEREATRDKEIREWYKKKAEKKEKEESMIRGEVFGKIFSKRREIREKRIHIILEERSKGKPLQAIGDILGITRERVRQIVVAFSPEENMYFHSFKIIDRRSKKRETRTCACGVKFEVLPSSKRKTCSRNCTRNAMTKKYMFSPDCPTERNKRNGWLWHHDPKYRAQHSKKMSEQWQRNKKNPAWYKRYLERNKIHNIRHVEKKKYGHAITPLPLIESL